MTPWSRVKAAGGLLRGQRGRVALGRRCDAGGLPSLAAADHSALDELLSRYVDADGLVAYAAWRATPADRDRLDGYLAGLGAHDPELACPLTHRLAYWVNAYNAVTLAGVLRDDSDQCLCRLRNRVLRFNPWRDLRLWVGQVSRSLDEIEHAELLPLGQPIVHFGLVCAARGCPPLRDETYAAGEIYDQLADNARRFFARPDAFRADPAARTLHLSPLLKWYARDFGASITEQVRAWRPYFPPSARLDWLDGGGVALSYFAYDWSLNEQGDGGKTPSEGCV